MGRESALDLLAGLVLEDGRRWGEAAAEFQWADARAVLEGPAPYNFLTRSRGGSKTDDLGGMAVAEMLTTLPPGSQLIGLAADRDQGRLLLDSIAGYAARTPLLRNALELGAYRVTACRGGSSLSILAADAPGAWGTRPRRLIVDELANWGSTAGPRRLWEAASSSAAKVKDSRMTVLTSAGDPAHWSHKLLEHALEDPLWRVNEVRGPAPWLNRERLEEQRRRLPPSSYQRLFENRWTAAEDRLTSLSDLRACVQLDGPLPAMPGHRYVIGVDIGLKNDRTVACVCHSQPVKRMVDVPARPGYDDATTREETVGVEVFLNRMQVWEGTREAPVRLQEVEEWIVQARDIFRTVEVVLDPWQAAGTMQRLRGRGLRVDEFAFSSQSVGRLAATLSTLLRDRALRLPDDPDLLDELANVRLRETSPGVLRMDHDPDQHDDRAISLALACQRLLARVSYDQGVTFGRSLWD